MTLTRVIFSAAVSLTLVSCGQQPANPASGLISLDGLERAASVEAADPAIKNVMDMRDSNPARVVIDVECGDPVGAPACGARAAVRAAAWLADHPNAPRELLINVDDETRPIGFQLRGDLPARSELNGLSVDAALKRFSWNGGSSSGKDAAASWCTATDARSGFCNALAEEACSPLAEGDLLTFCSRR